jgi:hypothetical protein
MRTIYKVNLPSFLFYTRKVGHLKRKKRYNGVISTYPVDLNQLLEQHPNADIFFYGEVNLNDIQCTRAFIFNRNDDVIIVESEFYEPIKL